jgi:amidase
VPDSTTPSNAFVATFTVPPTGSGPLDGLTFAVKDVIDVAGWTTGCGNPTWRDTHPPAAVHAVCVEQLLGAGARCLGKTVSDELAFSLLGRNHFEGTPLNPRAPDRVPGGSSSGSASAVACGLVDVALGTDTGGSVRVPASNCGLFGFRPSHGRISVAGVNPLAPSFDTVGLFAPTADLLARVAQVLLAGDGAPPREPGAIHVIREAFALADPDVEQALRTSLEGLRQRFGDRVREIALAEVTGDGPLADFSAWCDTYGVLQWAEIRSCLGGWIDAVSPGLGPSTAASLALTRQLDRRRIGEAVERRERIRRRLGRFLGPHDLLCLPTTPALAPRLAEADPARSLQGSGSGSTYYPRTLSLTSVAGLGRLPQVSLPMADVSGVPLGLSLLAAHGQDGFLLDAVRQLA